MSTSTRRGGLRGAAAAFTVILIALFTAVPAASAAARHRHHSHVEHFLVVTSDPSPSAVPFISATGPIHARGTDTVLSSTRDVFTFPKGSLSVTHHMNKKSVRNSYDPVTCTFRYTERGTYRVTGGTGSYAHARGHGRYAVRLISIGCDQNKAPDYFNEEIDAAGPLHPHG